MIEFLWNEGETKPGSENKMKWYVPYEYVIGTHLLMNDEGAHIVGFSNEESSTWKNTFPLPNEHASNG